jgi:hypothetical protein
MLGAVSTWDELIDGFRAQALREILCDAAAVAHRENGARFEPETLGDEALMYGLGTTINARHLAGRAIEDANLDGVAVCEHGRVWWLEIRRADESTVRVYFYKAPPGARSVHELRLDDTEIKKELSSSNGQQMALFTRSGAAGNALLLNILVVHFGDAEAGLQKLDVGAPYLHGKEIAWDWNERFDTDAASEGSAGVPTSPLGDEGGGYEGLRLLPKPDESAQEHGSGTAGEATSEFEALGLRDASEETQSPPAASKDPS